MPAVALNAVGTEFYPTAVTSISDTSLTIAAGSNTTLVVPMTFNINVTALTVTWGGVTLHQAPGQAQPATGTTCGFSYIYYLIGPATGTGPLAINWTGSSDCQGKSVAFNNAAGGVAGFTKATGSGTTASLVQTVSGAANDATIAIYQNISSNIPNTPTGTSLYGDGNHAVNGTAGYLLAPSASQTMSASLAVSDAWAVASADILNAAAVACQHTLPLLGVGCSVGWRAALLIRGIRLLSDNPTITRRRLLGVGSRLSF